MKNKKESAIIILEKLLDEKNMKSSSKVGYESELKCFKEFIKEKKKGSIVIDWNEINARLLSEYKVYIQISPVDRKIIFVFCLFVSAFYKIQISVTNCI